jgi:hypothetical protein
VVSIASDQPNGRAVNVIHVPLHQLGKGSFITLSRGSTNQSPVSYRPFEPGGNLHNQPILATAEAECQ